MLEEKTSKHLGVPFVEVEHEGEKKYLCFNGVLFKDSEYMDYADLQVEYERREKEDKLYDYAYAKSTGLLRKKRNFANERIHKESIQEISQKEDSSKEQKTTDEMVQKTQARSTLDLCRRTESKEADGGGTSEWNRSDFQHTRQENNRNIYLIASLLTFTSAISMYISTLHTATYLFDYVDVFSAWLMSASVTAYNSTAFEVSVLFKKRKRYSLTFIFITLWVMVTLFSMATTVSVFYDRFNFTEVQTAQENHQSDSNKLALELLRTKENDLRQAIEFKKKDIEYRQEKEYATTAVRKELNELEQQLQENLTDQQKLLESTPEVVQETIHRKESLFAFLGRLLHLEGGILEFTMSTLSAVFVNLICPFSLTAVIELMYRKEENLTK